MSRKIKDSQRLKEWRKNNPEKVKTYAKMRYKRDIEEIRKRNEASRRRLAFNGKCDEIYERDNWQCQICGMSPEQSIILFNKKLAIHHIDNKGESQEETNNDPENLVTLCIRCHAKLHLNKEFKEQWKMFLKE